MRTLEGLGYKARARVRTRMVTLQARRSTSLHTHQVQVWIQIQIHRVHVKFLIKAQDQFQEESEERMGRLNVDAHARIVNMWRVKFKVKEIVERLAEGVEVGYTAIYNLLSKFKKTELIGDLTRSMSVIPTVPLPLNNHCTLLLLCFHEHVCISMYTLLQGTFWRLRHTLFM